MAFGVANQSLPGRGPTPGLRFIAYVVLSITLMFLDRREGWMEQVRFGLQTAAYPLQLAVSSPGTAWSWLRESSRSRETLRAENTELRTRLRDLELRTMRYGALSQENATLRGLKAALPPVAEKWLVAEIVHVELDSRRPSRVLINRGASNGVFKGQVVMDDQGILGQTTHVGPWSAEVILINDPEHEIPVLIERTGVRTIASGTDDREASLSLPYLPANADIKVGDLLLTSGLGGVFPQGYPVAKVTEVHREVVQPSAQIRAEPLARVDRSREVMLVWFRDAHPAAPVPGGLADLKSGDASANPQATPPKPKTTAPATTGTVPATGAAGTVTPRAGTPTTPARPNTAGPRNNVPIPAPANSGTATPGTANPAPGTSSTPGATRTPGAGASTQSPSTGTSGATPAPGATARPNGTAPAPAAPRPTAPTQQPTPPTEDRQ